MPEARGQMTPVRGGARELMDGFLIRRAASPVGAAGLGRLLTLTDNKENIPPWGYGRRKRSPLPEWYPRTPLRDITAIVNALERRRIRVRAAAARQRNLQNESSPQLISPLPQELSLSNQTPSSQDTLSDLSDSSPHPTAAAAASSSFTTSEPSLQTSCVLTSSSPTKQSTKASLLSSDSAPDVDKSVEPGKKLLCSINEIEQMVMENVKRTTKAPAKKATRTSTLLSMR